MLYETRARPRELLQLDIGDLDIPADRCEIRSPTIDFREHPGIAHRGPFTAELLPRLIRDRVRGPVFLSHRRVGGRKLSKARDICPDTGQARLSYDRASHLLDAATAPEGPGSGWKLRQLRQSGSVNLASRLETLSTTRGEIPARRPPDLLGDRHIDHQRAFSFQHEHRSTHRRRHVLRRTAPTECFSSVFSHNHSATGASSTRRSTASPNAVHATTMADIRSRAQLSPNSVYSWYPGNNRIVARATPASTTSNVGSRRNTVRHMVYRTR